MPRLDVWLTQEGLFSSRQAAKRAIKEGHVTVNGAIVKSSKQVDGTEEIVVDEEAVDHPYGFRKLQELDAILDGNLINMKDKVLDIGSSAGGFLQYLGKNGAVATGIEVSEEFLPQLTGIVKQYDNVSLIIADAFEIDPEVVCGLKELDVLLVDVTTDPEGTLLLVNRFMPLLKDSGLLVCAFKSRPVEELIERITSTLKPDFDILHIVELDKSRQEFHVIASRRYVFNKL